MPGHGDHWSAVYAEDTEIESVIRRDLVESKRIDFYPCADIVNGTERAEELTCLRWGEGPLVEDMLVVTDSVKQTRNFVSGFPVLTKGIVHSAVVERVEPWEGGIEGWLHVNVTSEEVGLAVFDVRYYAGSASLVPGQQVNVCLAGLAYSLRPMAQTSVEVGQGAFWEMEKQRRLDEGESEGEASKPVTIMLAGMAVLIPRGGEQCDDAEFSGVIDAIETFTHAGITMYRLELVVLRAGDDAFKLPVFVSESVLDGYVPRLGEDVQGVMWIQGHILGKLAESSS
jgi:hypothetical protein